MIVYLCLMKKNFYKIWIVWLVCASTVQAQWSTNPQQNNQISTSGSGAALPYIVTHPGGTSYISWFSPGSGGDYYPYIQKLDVEGYIKWASSGIQVSSHPSMTWITDYSLAISPDTSVFIAFQDMRATGNDIFVYKISPSGTFLWGNDGVQLSNNPDFEADPVMAVHPDGSVVVAWPRTPNTGDATIELQRLNKNGQKQWNPDLIISESGFNCTWPRILPDENGNTTVIYYKEWGPYWAPNRNILAQKYDPGGNPLWIPGPVLFTGAMPLYVHPLVASDGLGGTYVCWFYEKVANHLSTFVQHVDQNGNVTIGSGGVEVNPDLSTLHLEPAIACDTSSHELYVFWRETDLNQNYCGLYGQKVSLDGTLGWGPNGKMFVPVSSKNVILVNVTALPGGVVAGYLYDDWGGTTQQKVRAIRVDSVGNTVWSNVLRDVSTQQSGKGDLSSDPFMNGQILYSWSDDRISGGEIFAQNICENGDLGPVNYDFTLSPDTLYFLTQNDISNGKSFYIGNPHDFSLDVQYVQQSGDIYPTGYASWYTTPHYSQFPVFIPPHDSLKETVKWIITGDMPLATLYYDSLDISTLTYSRRIIIAIDSSLIITGLGNKSSADISVFPNPFSGQVRITGCFPKDEQISLVVYNTLMQPVKTLYSGKPSGIVMSFTWDGNDTGGQKMSVGVYFITLQTKTDKKVIRVIMLI